MKALYKQILSQLEDGIIMFDASGKVFYDNLDGRRLSGLVENGRIVDQTVLNEVATTMACAKSLPKNVTISSSEIDAADVSAVLLSDDGAYCLYIKDNSAKSKFDVLRDNLFELINHELRTPMTAFMGGAQIISEILANSKYKEDVDFQAISKITIENGNRVVDKMKRLLELAESYSESPIRSDERVQLVEVAYDVVDSLRENSLEKSITVKVGMRGTSVGVVYGSYAWFKRALEEFVRNAIEHSYEGSDIHIQLGQVGNFASIIIRDYGRGITPEVKQSLYEPFTHGKDKDCFSRQGLGIGLTLAKWIIETHGGQIKQLDTETGVEFRIELPTSIGRYFKKDIDVRQTQLYAKDLALLMVKNARAAEVSTEQE